VGLVSSTDDILTEEELNSLRADIENMTRPSWLTGVPTNLGESSHGKLKADQWRTLGTIYLPVSLVRLWHKSSGDDERSARCKQLLFGNPFADLCNCHCLPSHYLIPLVPDLYLRHMKAYHRWTPRCHSRLISSDLIITWRFIYQNT
jgi:hypothetical protein